MLCLVRVLLAHASENASPKTANCCHGAVFFRLHMRRNLLDIIDHLGDLIEARTQPQQIIDPEPGSPRGSERKGIRQRHVGP